MDAFLTAVYAHYDLCIWSQTSWRWLELKLTELGFLSNPNYRYVVVVFWLLLMMAGLGVAAANCLSWIGLDWIGLDWIGFDWIGLDWIGLEWLGLDWIGLAWIGLDWIGLEWIGLDWLDYAWLALSWLCLGVACLSKSAVLRMVTRLADGVVLVFLYQDGASLLFALLSLSCFSCFFTCFFCFFTRCAFALA